VVNTALLLVFLRRNPQVAVGRALRSASLYALKLALFSAVAALPVLLLRGRLLSLFAGGGRLIAYGLPLAAGTLLYGGIGIGLLTITGDPQLKALRRSLTRSTKRQG
jgi:putative peptidoglycan lipid II flippase